MTVVQLHPRAPSESRARVAAALDIGSSKTSCVIAQIQPRPRNAGEEEQSTLKILGFGQQASYGVRAGVITDLDQAERSIRLAVDAAERMAQRTISEVYVNVSGGRPSSALFAGSRKVEGDEVARDDLDAAVADALRRADIGKRALLHASPARFDLDDAQAVSFPLGMAGESLACEVNVVTCDKPAMRNLAAAVARCHLGVAGFVIAPYAAAKSVLTDDEVRLGVTLVDLGAQTTGIAAFKDGHLVFADVLPIGSQHVTNDIARGLSTTVAHAERMKTLWGSALASVVDERETIAVPQLGERGVGAVQQIPKSMLTGIIRPRMEEIFEMVNERLEASPAARRAGRRAVLCGGGSQLVGAREMACQWLQRQVRLGAPRVMQGMPDAAKFPGFAAVNGLLHYAIKPDRSYDLPDTAQISQAPPQGYVRRVGRWIAESF